MMDRRRLMLNREVALLPSGFKRVEYLESTGTQFIKTGIEFNSANTYEIMTVAQLRGSNELSGWNAGGIFGSMQGFWSDGMNYTSVSGTVKSEIDLKITNGNTTLRVGDEVLTRDNSNLALYAKMPYPIFAYTNESGGIRSVARMRIYDEFLIFLNSTIRWHGVPCLDENDKPLFYDIINGERYYNAGTGEFPHGQIVSDRTVARFDRQGVPV